MKPNIDNPYKQFSASSLLEFEQKERRKFNLIARMFLNKFKKNKEKHNVVIITNNDLICID